jgi:CheY-like chemotaxis protein
MKQTRENEMLRVTGDCPGLVKSIMVVEDYDDTRFMLQTLLERAGYDVVVCENGGDAIKKFVDSFRCRANAGILMDLSLPDINGLRVMSAIRELEKGSTSGCEPIHMGVVSAVTDVVEGVDSFDDIGVTLMLKKPVNPSILLDMIVKWLQEPVPDLYKVSKNKAAYTSGVGAMPRMS